MIEVFSSPRIDRGIVAQKMLAHVLIALAAVGASTAMLFVSMGRDSQANRDAIYKTTSSESEFWLVVTCIASVVAIFYISVAGYVHTLKIRNQFSNWAYYKDKLYYIASVVPRGRVNTRKISRVISIQDKIIGILNDENILVKILDKEIKSDDIRVIEVEKIDTVRHTKRGMKVRFHGKKAEIMREVYGYERLASLIDSFAQD